MVARVARREGFDVRDTPDPDEFVALVARDRPDVVAIDVIMPDKDGVEIVGELAGIGFAGRLLIMSGYHGDFMARASKLADAYGLNVLGTLPKPINVDDLRKMLREAENGTTEIARV